MRGFVYVIDFGRFVKIGSTARPRSRIKCIERELELKPVNVHVSESLNGYEYVERKVHGLFSDSHCENETYRKECFSVPFETCVDVLSNIVEVETSLDESMREKYWFDAGKSLRVSMAHENIKTGDVYSRTEGRISRSRIGKIIKGKIEPTQYEIRLLCKAFKVKVSVFIARGEEG